MTPSPQDPQKYVCTRIRPCPEDCKKILGCKACVTESNVEREVNTTAKESSSPKDSPHDLDRVVSALTRYVYPEDLGKETSQFEEMLYRVLTKFAATMKSEGAREERERFEARAICFNPKKFPELAGRAFVEIERTTFEESNRQEG